MASAPGETQDREAHATAPAGRQGDRVDVYRARDLFLHKDEWVGRTVTVNLFEPVRDHSIPSFALPGRLTVETEGMTVLQLIGSEVDPRHPKQHPMVLPRRLVAPVRVTGTLLRDFVHGRLVQRDWLVVRVDHLAPIQWPEPEPVPSARELDLHPERWDGHYVAVDGTQRDAFETSRLQPGTWLDFHPGVVIGGSPARARDRTDPSLSHVRVVGFAFTGRRFGHMGVYRSKIVANQLTYLDMPPTPARSDIP